MRSTPRWSASGGRRAPPGFSSGETATEAIWFSLREKLGATEFLGYDTESAEGVVAALVRDGKELAELKAPRAARWC